MKGIEVQYATAYDAFGLPNEAPSADGVEVESDPFVAGQIRRIRSQLRSLRLSYTLDQHPSTCDPEYYCWTQWLFLRLWQEGLVYSKQELIPFCETCHSFLAATQLDEGACWRCASLAGARRSLQWYIRTTDFNDRLFEGIASLTGWSRRARNLVRSHLGRMDGHLMEVEIRTPTTISLVRLFSAGSLDRDVIIRSDHPLAVVLSQGREYDGGDTISRTSRNRGGRVRVPLGRVVIGSHQHSLFAVPPGDVPSGLDAMEVDSGQPVHLPLLHGTVSKRTEFVAYRAKDWLVTRNRKWGTPFPAVSCKKCGIVPVSESQLPVLLPQHGGAATLECPTCSTPSRPVERILDCFLDDSWAYFAARRGWDSSQNPFESWKDNAPSAVAFHTGYDSFVYLHLYRFLGHALFDMGYVAHPETTDHCQGVDLVTSRGRKMAKRHGNAPDLDELLSEHGADVIRLSVLAGANPSKPLNWSTDCLLRGKKMVSMIRRLRMEAGNDPSGKHPLRLDATEALDRIEALIGQYRIGAAIDALYALSGRLLRCAESPDVSRTLSIWALFAPESERSE